MKLPAMRQTPPVDAASNAADAVTEKAGDAWDATTKAAGDASDAVEGAADDAMKLQKTL